MEGVYIVKLNSLTSLVGEDANYLLKYTENWESELGDAVSPSWAGSIAD